MSKELNMDAIKAEYDKLVKLYSKLYSDIEGIKEEIKQAKESIKLEGGNPALVAKIAKACVQDNKDKLESESQEVLDLVEALS